MDGGGEYKSNELKNYCDNNGIPHQQVIYHDKMVLPNRRIEH
jgi:hypothetical protein